MRAATWGQARQLAIELDKPANSHRRTLLRLIGQLPLISEQELRRVLGLSGPSSIGRRLTFLHEVGLIASIRTSMSSGRPRRLFHITDLGLAALAVVQNADAAELAHRQKLDEAGFAWLIPRLPLVQASHDLLGTIVTSLGADAGELRIERPWRRTFQRLTAKNPLSVELPMCVALPWRNELHLDCLLLPDLGMFGAGSYRRLLRNLTELRREMGGYLPVLVIGTRHEGAAHAWRTVLADVAEELGEAPLSALVGTEAGLAEMIPSRAASFATRHLRAQRWKPLQPRRDRAWISAFTGRHILLHEWLVEHLALVSDDREVIDLIGRYPLLSAGDIAVLRQTPESQAERQCARLAAMGFVEQVQPLKHKRAVPDTGHPGDEDATVPRALMLTRNGFAAAAGRCILPHEFVRRKILGADGTKPQQRREARLRGHFAHTRGIVDIFIGLLRHAARNRAGGGDDALLEWRSDVFCSCRTLQPDGYGVYQHNGRRYAFFLEFDRATERNRDYQGKFSAYYQYRDSGTYQRDYNGFPTILLITTGRQDTEQRIAAAARDVGIGHPAPLPLLLTSTWRLRAKANTDGPLGEIWRTVENPQRRRWQLGPRHARRAPMGARE